VKTHYAARRTGGKSEKLIPTPDVTTTPHIVLERGVVLYVVSGIEPAIFFTTHDAPERLPTPMLPKMGINGVRIRKRASVVL
jgi:hypothetical protein